VDADGVFCMSLVKLYFTCLLCATFWPCVTGELNVKDLDGRKIVIE
jgi:hypothetical protein